MWKKTSLSKVEAIQNMWAEVCATLAQVAVLINHANHNKYYYNNGHYVPIFRQILSLLCRETSGQNDLGHCNLE